MQQQAHTEVTSDTEDTLTAVWYRMQYYVSISVLSEYPSTIGHCMQDTEDTLTTIWYRMQNYASTTLP